jgi:hypothetical protein
MKEVVRVLKNNGIVLFFGEPFLPRYLLGLQFLYSRFDKKQGICERVFSLEEWLSFMKDFKILSLQLEGPESLKNIFPNISLICKYLTGGSLSFVLQKK